MTDIKNIDGEVIYTSKKPNDTIKQALEQAVKARVSLHKADLRDANLRGANLLGARLWEAHLRWADLSGADLSGADLEGADLWGAKIQLGNKTLNKVILIMAFLAGFLLGLWAKFNI